MNSCKELLDISMKEFAKVTIYNDKEILCYRTVKKIWGEDRACILIYSEELYRGQYEGLLKSIEKKNYQMLVLKWKIKKALMNYLESAKFIF